MHRHHPPVLDFKQLAREIRAGGLALGRLSMEAEQKGAHPDDVAEIDSAAARLHQASEAVEGWRVHHAEALHRLADQLDLRMPREPGQPSLDLEEPTP